VDGVGIAFPTARRLFAAYLSPLTGQPEQKAHRFSEIILQ
jgi:hypothetical protein